MTLSPLLVLALCRAPVDYRVALEHRAAAHAEALNAAGEYQQAIDWARAWQSQVEPGALVAYEIGYAYNRMARLDDAIDAYGQALRIDPRQAAARYDRGEILLSQGELDEAEADLAVAAELRPDHWAVHFRLAEIAGRRGDPSGLESHLTDAIRVGFSFDTLLADPQWRGWFRDDKLGPVLIKLVTMYGDERLLEGL